MNNKSILSENLSNNNVASDNLSKNTLINFNNDFSGLSNAIAMLFPSIRNAYVERYKAKTAAITGQIALEIVNKLNLKTKAIPPKAALPLFEKMSLEHEEEMYEMWAKLLVDTAVDFKSINTQYSEILSQICSIEASLLKKIYTHQKTDKFGRDFANRAKSLIEDYQIQNGIAQMADQIKQGMTIGGIDYLGEDFYGNQHTGRDISIIIEDPDRPDLEEFLYEIDYLKYKEHNIIVLERLGLVKIFYEANADLIALTEFGYELIETLEKYNID